MNTKNLDEFSEKNYIKILTKARSNYKFCKYSNLSQSPHLILRHDVDICVHSAQILAQLESKEGIYSTYFFLLNSHYYNLFEPETRDIILNIASMGHDIGLHFSSNAHQLYLDAGDSLKDRIQLDTNIIEAWLKIPLQAISFHDPIFDGELSIQENYYGDLINTYSRKFYNEYEYCSDSNGYWRHRPINEILDAGHPKIQFLTHPVWWTQSSLSPREKVKKCAEDRAYRIINRYDRILKTLGRKNI